MKSNEIKNAEDFLSDDEVRDTLIQLVHKLGLKIVRESYGSFDLISVLEVNPPCCDK